MSAQQQPGGANDMLTVTRNTMWAWAVADHRKGTGLFKWVWIAVAAVLHLVVYGSLLWTAYTQAVKAGAEYEWVAKAGVPMCAFFMLDKWAEYLQHQHVAPITGEFTCRLFLVLGAGMCSIVLCAVHVWKTIASNRLWLAAAAAVAAVGVGVAMGSSYKPGD